MSREYYFYAEGRIHDNYFRLDDGTGLDQNEKIKILMDNDVHLCQVVIQTATSSQLKLIIQLPSGTEYDIKSFSNSATYFILNDASHYSFWSQMVRGSRLIVQKTDTGSTGLLEVGVTARPIQ